MRAGEWLILGFVLLGPACLLASAAIGHLRQFQQRRLLARPKPFDDPQGYQLRQAIIMAYGDRLAKERLPAHVRDARLLPYPKETILAALRHAFVNTRSEIEANIIANAAVSLAGYQPGAGSRTAPRPWWEGCNDLSDEEVCRLLLDSAARRYAAYDALIEHMGSETLMLLDEFRTPRACKPK